MARYINVDLTEAEIADKVQEITANADVFIAVRKVLGAFRAADVQEVKHGKWIKNKEHGYYECSNCKSTKPYDGICEENPDKVTYWMCDYCPYCGTKMDGDKDV